MKTENELEIETIKDKISDYKNQIIHLQNIIDEFKDLFDKNNDKLEGFNISFKDFENLKTRINGFINKLTILKIDPLRMRLSELEGN